VTVKPSAVPGTAQRDAALAKLAQRFPLVPRPRPACRPFDERIARVCALARQASAGGTDSLVRAAEAHNLAALILSDCGLPAAARDLCRRQARCYAGGPPHELPAAKLALQPLINIGRLLIRAADPSAHQHFMALFDSAAHRSQVMIDGIPVNFADLTVSADHKELVRWLWTILLADGTRALTSTGRWAEASRHIATHGGVGDRLLDGRQVIVLAHGIAHHTEAARNALRDSNVLTPWERAAASCLHVLLSALTDEPADDEISAMAEAYRQLNLAGEDACFRIRLGLCVLVLSTGTCHERPVARQVINAALDSDDAYRAHAIAFHRACLQHATPAEASALAAAVRAAGLSQGTLPPDASARLMSATEASEQIILREWRQSLPNWKPS